MKNEILEKKIEKMYKEYYSAYNNGFRQQYDKRPDTQVSGLASWSEKPALTVIENKGDNNND